MQLYLSCKGDARQRIKRDRNSERSNWVMMSIHKTEIFNFNSMILEYLVPMKSHVIVLRGLPLQFSVGCRYSYPWVIVIVQRGLSLQFNVGCRYSSPQGCRYSSPWVIVIVLRVLSLQFSAGCRYSSTWVVVIVQRGMLLQFSVGCRYSSP